MCAVMVLVLQGDSEKICRGDFWEVEEHIHTFPLLLTDLSSVPGRKCNKVRHQLLIGIPGLRIKN